MKFRKHGYSLSIVCVLLLSFSWNVQAVVIDFNATPLVQFQTANYFEDGFRMTSPAGHYDFEDDLFVTYTSPDNTHFLVVDNDGSGARPGPISSVRFDNFGGLFTLESMEVIFGDTQALLTSSSGGSAVRDSTGLLKFSSPLWSDLNWIDITVNNELDDSWVAIDNIRFSSAVPEPMSLGLLGLGLVALGFGRCRRS